MQKQHTLETMTDDYYDFCKEEYIKKYELQKIQQDVIFLSDYYLSEQDIDFEFISKEPVKNTDNNINNTIKSVTVRYI